MTLSVCAIIKNEEKRITSFVKNVQEYAEEIIIVDNGSSDESVNIAKKMGCKTIICKDEFDFARNAYISMASSEWILTLDLDEFILPEHFQYLREQLKIIEGDKECGVVCMPHFDYFGNGRWSVWYLSRVIRNIKSARYSTSMHGGVASSILLLGKRAAYIYAPIHHYDGLCDEKTTLTKRDRNINLLKKNILAHPQNPKLHIRLATEYCALGDYKQAEFYALKGCELNVNNKELAFEQLARVYLEERRYEKCFLALDKQISIYIEKINQGNPYAIRYYKSIDFCNCIRINAYYQMGNFLKALEITKNNIIYNPELPHNYINYYILDPTKVEMYQRALKLNPMLNNPIIFGEERKYTLYSQSPAILPHDGLFKSILSQGGEK